MRGVCIQINASLELEPEGCQTEDLSLQVTVLFAAVPVAGVFIAGIYWDSFF